MKQLLSLLLCFVFLNATTFAKHEWPGGALTNITGTYGGVLLPTSTKIDGVVGSPSNSLGLFSFVLPQGGFGAGAMLMFANGTVYTGTITAVGDPSTLQITGIIQASYDFTLQRLVNSGSGTTLISEPLTAQANGTMKTTVEPLGGLIGLPSLIGTATIEVSQGQVDPTTFNPIIVEETEYSVTGVQQTTSTSITTSTGITLPTGG